MPAAWPLGQLEFYAHADLFMNPTAELADIVLTVASAFEREGLKTGFEISAEAQSLFRLRPAIVPSPAEVRADNDIIFDLAVRLGRGVAGHLGAPTRRRRLDLEDDRLL